MKAFFLLLAFLTLPLYSQNEKSKLDIIQTKSLLLPGTDKSTYPMPFNAIENSVYAPAVSTGYYFVDSDDGAPDAWKPSFEWIDTSYKSADWLRIISGPRQLDTLHWFDPLYKDEGQRFFRNPALPKTGSYFKHGVLYATDSTDDALAGPMPIRFPFYFNGLRMDSFYVSTNGIVALTNRRYHYNSSGERTIPLSMANCYDINSIDWFERARIGNGLSDTIKDDYGYNAILGNKDDLIGGIRKKGGGLDGIPLKNQLIGVLFADCQLSQWNKKLNKQDPHGAVMFLNDTANKRLIIYYKNLQLAGKNKLPDGSEYDAPLNARSGDINYVAASAQVILNGKDSSITISFGSFSGEAALSLEAVYGKTPAAKVFSYNSTTGLCGYSRVAGNDDLNPWLSEYKQFTNYNSLAYTERAMIHSNMSIRFKQWKNCLRTVDLQYRVRNLDTNSNLDFTQTVNSSAIDYYEILAGTPRIGAIQPVGIFQNLTNDLQGEKGVNYTVQQVRFKATCKIINEASGRIVYNRSALVDSISLATNTETRDSIIKIYYSRVSYNNGDYTASKLPFPGQVKMNGLPPYGYVQIFFPPFEPNLTATEHIGRLNVQLMVQAVDHINYYRSYGEAWPFDDTLQKTLMVMKRLNTLTFDSEKEFHMINGSSIPNVNKWVSKGAEVVSAKDISINPLPPQSNFSAMNNSGKNLNSPVIKMNRLDYQGKEYKGSRGDELLSFPIDMRGRYKTKLSIMVQRGETRQNYKRGWNDNELTGPEPRIVWNNNILDPWNDPKASAYTPDEICLEYAQPSPDGLSYVTNIPESRWRYHPRRGGARPETKMPALSILGGGGYMTGFLENDRDSALHPPSHVDPGGLRPNIYDDGFDREFKFYIASIPDTFLVNKAAAQNFRFRIVVNSDNDSKCIACIPDDDDKWFVDEVRILYDEDCCIDVGIVSVFLNTPYARIPANIATAIPVKVNLVNNSVLDAPNFQIRTIIYPKGEQKAVYCQNLTVPYFFAATQKEFSMPDWNARKAGPGTYILQSIVRMPGGDMYEFNDTVRKEVTITFSDVLAYDYSELGKNEVPEFLNEAHRGLNLFGYSESGDTNGVYDVKYIAGDNGGDGAGQIAVKFVLPQDDSLNGFQVFWADLTHTDNVDLSVYNDNKNLPGTKIAGSTITRMRGIPDILVPGIPQGSAVFNKYINYIFKDINGKPKPLYLTKGTYWITVAQKGTGFELGASADRSGMRSMSLGSVFPYTNANFSFYADKSLRSIDRSGKLVNDNFFAYENIIDSKAWVPFSPALGNPAYAHSHTYGKSLDKITLTGNRGTWIPMLRPYFGTRAFGPREYNDCVVPVELAYFEGDSRNSGIDLHWATGSEINNSGFEIEKREFELEENWENIGFVKGYGNSASMKYYNFLDADVKAGNSYEYRLRQIDHDGTVTCHTSHTLLIKHDADDTKLFAEVSPNPFAEYTAIKYKISKECRVKLEIFDSQGNLARSLENKFLTQGNYTSVWNGRTERGEKAASGLYFVKISAGDEISVYKITLKR